jgi:hypothetical protein
MIIPISHLGILVSNFILKCNTPQLAARGCAAVVSLQRAEKNNFDQALRKKAFSSFFWHTLGR